LSQKDSSRLQHAKVPQLNPDDLEVAPGAEREQLEGWVPELASKNDLQAALEHAFDYRGDVVITRKDGSQVEGYVFDRRAGETLFNSVVRVLPRDGSPKVSIYYADIARLAFTGRDMAAGKSWETWVRQYWEKKSGGRKEHFAAPGEARVRVPPRGA
jgi:hypothetical protein